MTTDPSGPWSEGIRWGKFPFAWAFTSTAVVGFLAAYRAENF